MPQLLFFALIGAAAWYGYKALTREMQRVGEAVRDAADETDTAGVKVIADLERDPETGVYRPKQ